MYHNDLIRKTSLCYYSPDVLIQKLVVPQNLLIVCRKLMGTYKFPSRQFFQVYLKEEKKLLY